MFITLQQLATIFRKSSAGKGHAQGKYFLIDYEKFLRLAKLADGDERELAEKELVLAETQSNGLLSIDRHAKSHDPERIRLDLHHGEEWLFRQLGEPSPTQQRHTLAQFFEKASKQTDVPSAWKTPWVNHFQILSHKSLTGQTIIPFKRDDTSYNQDLLKTLSGVLNWKDESLIRYASAVICGHSKRLEELEPQLEQLLEEITGNRTLESWGILHKPRSVTVHGPLLLKIESQMIDFTLLPGPYALSESNLRQSSELTTTATICLSVENQDVFHELAKQNSSRNPGQNPGIFIILTSYPGSAVRTLYSLLPNIIQYYHFGDSDPSGFDILRDLREKTKRPIHPILMEHKPSTPALPLSDYDKKLIQTLLQNPTLEDVKPTLRDILHTNDKGLFEQEHIPLAHVLNSLQRIQK